MSPLSLEIIVFVSSTFISHLLLKKVIPYLALDIPNNRSLHNSPIYRGGGLVFIFVAFLTIPFTKFYSLFFLIPLITISYLDDLFTTTPKIRFSIQLLTVFFILYYCLNLPINNITFYIMFLVGGTAIINFTNFMDGIDGLVAANMIIAFLHLSLFNQSTNLYPTLGGLIAFLSFNKSPAKVFMGDVGSTFLGAIFFMEIIKLTDYRASFLSLCALFPIYLDAFICLLARFYNKENVFLSHKKHLYQRLVAYGFSHNKVTILYSLCSALICLSCYSNNLSIILITMSFVLLVGILLNKFFAIPFVERNK